MEIATESRLKQTLSHLSPLAVAVSGGVDSMTLAVIAHRHLRDSPDGPPMMIHAVSPAVPEDASSRVKAYAAAEGWWLDVIDAGEFEDPDYMANPANRCFFCKTNLYSTMATRTTLQLVSGTNVDDLGDYRPGLKAAETHSVRHPYVEANIDKAGVRKLAHALSLDDLAELPAAPCLSSRVETGIRIDPAVLLAVDTAEAKLRKSLSPTTVRCRVRSDAIAIELDELTLAQLDDIKRQNWQREITRIFSTTRANKPVVFDAYTRGSAFLVETLK